MITKENYKLKPDRSKIVYEKGNYNMVLVEKNDLKTIEAEILVQGPVMKSDE